MSDETVTQTSVEASEAEFKTSLTDVLTELSTALTDGSAKLDDSMWYVGENNTWFVANVTQESDPATFEVGLYPLNDYNEDSSIHVLSIGTKADLASLLSDDARLTETAAEMLGKYQEYLSAQATSSDETESESH